MSVYGIDNLATLPELDENTLIRELKVRYEQNVIYVSFLLLVEEILCLPFVSNYKCHSCNY